jgi:hypothetical protein
MGQLPADGLGLWHHRRARCDFLAQAIDSWIASIAEVHRDKQPQSVHYSCTMPDIDTLMQEWPEEVEAALSQAQLPSADLDVSLAEYTDIVCSRLRAAGGPGACRRPPPPVRVRSPAVCCSSL